MKLKNIRIILKLDYYLLIFSNKKNKNYHIKKIYVNI